MLCVARQGRDQEFSLGARIEGLTAEIGAGVLGRGQQSPPHQLGACGALRAPSVEPRPSKGFPLFSALRMASPDTISLSVLTAILQVNLG